MPNPAEELRKLRNDGLLRTLQPLDSPTGPRVIRNGRELWNFSSNDYLGLARHPKIEAALIDGVHRFGAGAAASRLVCGTLPPHTLLENALADAKHTEAALLFTSGFTTALGAIPAIVGKSDFVVLDKLCHACLVDAARLSGATLRNFPHNDLGKLRHILSTIRARNTDARILLATESVFSMDGDLCPLSGIVELAEAYDALLFLDEAHGFGVLGPTGMGLAEQENLQHRVTFQMGTLSKAAGLSGGYLAASREWIDLLTNRARSFIYSTAPPPAIAHAGLAALQLIRSDAGKHLRTRLMENLSLISKSSTPIIPKIIGSNEAALNASSSLADSGLLIPAIRYPTVPRGTARLRISISAAHPIEAIKALKETLARVLSCSP
ncbi:MAG: 8-amino-7-oxononanoate synthase [Gloeobacteraceae cyanobacterium ES-bin-144]|nr:8-amino-7-oxononanoate synthase [Verrucomicrobiales bacterium]